MKEYILKKTAQVAQGDILITPFDGEIPIEYVAVTALEHMHVLAHSETGHHHVMEAKTVDFFCSANDAFVSYIDVKKPTELRHLRGFDTHKTIVFPAGKYRVNRQGEQTPEGWKRVED